MATKQEIINKIHKEDERQGLFYKAGNPRYKMEYHYGKLDKYSKIRLNQMLERLKATAETPMVSKIKKIIRDEVDLDIHDKKMFRSNKWGRFK